MSAHINYLVRRLLNLFQETWAERDACRTAYMLEGSGHTADWETILYSSRIQAQELFQPALSGLHQGVAVILVIEQLLERLEKS
jgi:hypothetical protein